jgi:hypothetical protein
MFDFNKLKFDEESVLESLREDYNLPPETERAEVVSVLFKDPYTPDHNCQSCYYRHGCPHEFEKMFPRDENGEYIWDNCKHWRLGKCYLCKYFQDTDEEWYKRGCETWCLGGCREHFKRNWKATLKWWFKRVVEDRE